MLLGGGLTPACAQLHFGRAQQAAGAQRRVVGVLRPTLERRERGLDAAGALVQLAAMRSWASALRGLERERRLEARERERRPRDRLRDSARAGRDAARGARSGSGLAQTRLEVGRVRRRGLRGRRAPRRGSPAPRDRRASPRAPAARQRTAGSSCAEREGAARSEPRDVAALCRRRRSSRAARARARRPRARRPDRRRPRATRRAPPARWARRGRGARRARATRAPARASSPRRSSAARSSASAASEPSASSAARAQACAAPAPSASISRARAASFQAVRCAGSSASERSTRASASAGRPSVFEGFRQAQVIGGAGAALRGSSHQLANTAANADAIAAAQVQLGQLQPPRRRELAERRRLHVGAQRARRLVRVIARDLARAQPGLLASRGIALAPHLDLALVETERAVPVLHRFEQRFEREQRLEIVRIGFERGGVAAARPRRRLQAPPGDVAEPPQQRGALAGRRARRLLDLALERLRDHVPGAEALGDAAQPAQRVERIRARARARGGRPPRRARSRAASRRASARARASPRRSPARARAARRAGTPARWARRAGAAVAAAPPRSRSRPRGRSARAAGPSARASQVSQGCVGAAQHVLVAVRERARELDRGGRRRPAPSGSRARSSASAQRAQASAGPAARSVSPSARSSST